MEVIYLYHLYLFILFILNKNLELHVTSWIPGMPLATRL